MKKLFFLFLLFCSIQASSQTEDAGAWMYFVLEKDLPDKFTTGIELDVRLNENLSEARSIFSEVYLSKEWSDAFSSTLTYRALARRNLENNYNDRDRLSLDLKYKLKVGEVSMQYRFRVQRRLGLLGSEGALNSNFGYRHKVKATYDLNKKWEVSLAGESFYAAQNTSNLLQTDIRVKASLEYKVKKRNYLSFGYLVQREYNTVNPLTMYNAVVGYKLMIK